MQLPDTDQEEQPINGSVRVTDLTFLKEFTEGDQAQMRKYIAMYLETAPKNLELIRQAIATNDLAAVKRIAHQLKPHLRFMGMPDSSALAEKIEHLAAADILDELPELTSILHRTCEASFAELSEYLSV